MAIGPHWRFYPRAWITQLSGARTGGTQIDVHVGHLRRALNRGRASDPIRTVRGTGYSFDERFGKDGPLSRSA